MRWYKSSTGEFNFLSRLRYPHQTCFVFSFSASHVCLSVIQSVFLAQFNYLYAFSVLSSSSISSDSPFGYSPSSFPSRKSRTVICFGSISSKTWNQFSHFFENYIIHLCTSLYPITLFAFFYYLFLNHVPLCLSHFLCSTEIFGICLFLMISLSLSLFLYIYIYIYIYIYLSDSIKQVEINGII